MTRARAFGLPLPGTPGPSNAITDVPGVEVGYTTLIEGDDVRTGVTALLPRGREGFTSACAAGMYSLNGNGEMTGAHWIAETGALALPVLITSTHSVGACHQGVIEWALRERADEARDWMLPVVAETWDGYLHDIDRQHIRPEHAIAAIDAARGGPVAEGSVGGGTGMNSFGFKAGSGTASQVVEYGDDTYTVGAFVQANFGAREQLTVCGAPVGADLTDDNPMRDTDWRGLEGAGSIIVIVGTDAPLLPAQSTALARRVPIALGRTGGYGHHSSGDIFLAFSTGNPGSLDHGLERKAGRYATLRFVPWNEIDPFYDAAVHAVEEAIYNALLAGETMVGRRGHRSPGLPEDRLRELLSARGVL